MNEKYEQIIKDLNKELSEAMATNETTFKIKKQEIEEIIISIRQLIGYPK
jgi:hypothetical protein